MGSYSPQKYKKFIPWRRRGQENGMVEKDMERHFIMLDYCDTCMVFRENVAGGGGAGVLNSNWNDSSNESQKTRKS